MLLSYRKSILRSISIAGLVGAASSFGLAKPIAASPCPRTDAKLAVTNATGKTLKSIVVVHRVGKDGDDMQLRTWANLPHNAKGGSVDIHFIATKQGWSIEDLDWWTVFFSFEEIVGYDAQNKAILADNVFRLEPYNGQGALDNVSGTLQSAIATVGPAELAALTAANPLSPAMKPLVDPVFKLISALLIKKGASLNGYKRINLQCRDAGKTVTVTIGGKKNALTVDIVIPDGDDELKMVARNTNVDASKIRETIEKRLAPPSATADKGAANAAGETAKPK